LTYQFNAYLRTKIDSSAYDGRNYGLVLADDIVAAEPVVVEPAEPVVEFTASGMRRVVIDDADDATFSTDGLTPKRGRGRSKPKPRAKPKPKAAPQANAEQSAVEAPAPVEPAEIPEW
jgi:hypothetical protein